MKMHLSSLSVAAVTALACLVSRGAGAAPPSGSYQVVVSGSQEIFLPSGSISQCAGSANLELCMNVDFAANRVGLFEGGGTVTVSGLANGVLDATAAGGVGGLVTKPRVNLGLAFSGDIGAAGYPGTGRGVISLGCRRVDVLDPTVLACKGRITACGAVAGFGSACAGAPLSTTIGAQGGPWTLTLGDLATDSKNRVTGMGEVSLATGQVLDFQVTGKYNPKQDLSTLQLTGTGPSTTARVTLVRFSPDANVGLMKFRLGGQTGSLDLSTLP